MRKLSRNLIATVASFVFLLIIAVGFFAAFQGRKIINNGEEKYASLYLQDKQTSVNDIMVNIKDSVDVLAVTARNDLASAEVLSDDDKREAYTKKMAEILETVSENTSGAVFSYLRFSPELAPSTSGIFLQKNEVNGRFTSLTPTDFSKYDENDTEHVGWYYIPVKSGHSVWMSPYMNDNVGVYMISYVVPLFVGDTAVGVLGMDIDFSYITSLLKDTKLYKTGYICLLDEERKVQYHPSLTLGTVFSKSSKEFIADASLSNGMTIELVIPNREIYASGNALMYEIIISIAVIFVIYCLGLTLFLRGIAKRDRQQKELNNEINSVAGIYISMHKISVRKNQIKEYYASDFLSAQFQRNFPRIKDLLFSLIRQIVVTENQESMREFCNVDTLEKRMTDRKTISIEFQSGEFGWCRARFIRISDQSVADEAVFAIEQINDEKEKENHLLYLSETDMMTSIRNRGSGEKCIRDLVEKKKKGAFLLMDIDKFKRFNDTYGHAAGDDVIVAVATSLRNVFCNGEVVMRLGGDEFAVFLPNALSEYEVKQKIYILFSMIETIRLDSIGKQPIYLSLGISFYDGENYQSFDEMYHDADQETYRSKEVTGNSYSFHNKAE